MTIYSSNKSCWQRHKAGLPQDHAGSSTVDTDTLKDEPVVEQKESVKKESEKPEVVNEVVEKEGKKVIGEVVERITGGIKRVIGENKE